MLIVGTGQTVLTRAFTLMTANVTMAGLALTSVPVHMPATALIAANGQLTALIALDGHLVLTHVILGNSFSLMTANVTTAGLALATKHVHMPPTALIAATGRLLRLSLRFLPSHLFLLSLLLSPRTHRRPAVSYL